MYEKQVKSKIIENHYCTSRHHSYKPCTNHCATSIQHFIRLERNDIEKRFVGSFLFDVYMGHLEGKGWGEWEWYKRVV